MTSLSVPFPSLDQPELSVSGMSSEQMQAQLHARYKSRIRPLDLAAPSSKLTPPRVGQHHKVSLTLLTPPLTPSSSFTSADSSPYEYDDPDTPPSPTPRKNSHPNGELTGYGTRARAMSSSASLDTATGPLSSPTRRAASPARSRFLLIRNVPADAPAATLRAAFAPAGDVKGILVRFQEHGVVVLAFFDVRHAARACRLIPAQDPRLTAEFIQPAPLEDLIGRSAFVAETDGSLYLTVESRTALPLTNLRAALTSFGELITFAHVGAEDSQTYHVEYCDSRDAASALQALDNRTMLGCRLRLYAAHDSPPVSPQRAGSPDVAGEIRTDRDFVRPDGKTRPRSVSASESITGPDTVRRLFRERESLMEHSRRNSNYLFFDAVGKLTPLPRAPTRPRSISIDSVHGPDSLAGDAHAYLESPLSPPVFTHPFASAGESVGEPWSPSAGEQWAPSAGRQHTPPTGEQWSPSAGEWSPSMGENWTFAPSPVAGPEYYLPPTPRHQPSYGTTPTREYPHVQEAACMIYPETPSYFAGGETAIPYYTGGENPYYVSGGSPYYTGAVTPHYSDGETPYFSGGDTPYYADADTIPKERTTGLHHGSGCGGRDPHAIPEKNQLNLQKIEDGLDTRTTVMVKNIPNKMSDRDLLTFIGRVCPRRVDFVYLRMDFQNGCNVGYAFVNFITVQDLLRFARTQLGVKWNMYSSEKVLQMSYANYQGKEALVEKFKNSCIMDEREAWRPKIFYSDGPDQGLPEPFPAPTHRARKERSSHNKGALFVPGAAHFARNEARFAKGDTRFSNGDARFVKADARFVKGDGSGRPPPRLTNW